MARLHPRRKPDLPRDAHYCLAAGAAMIGTSDDMTGLTLDLKSFRVSLAEPQPPAGLSPALQALWWDAKGDWHRAHERAQERDDAAGTRVHAYLHRKEGDQSNAEYWYRRSGAAPSILTLDEEWQELAESLLARG